MERWLHSELASKIMDSLLPVFAVLAALLVGAFMLVILGANRRAAHHAPRPPAPAPGHRPGPGFS